MIGLLLAFVAAILLRETKGLLIGEGLQVGELLRLKDIVEKHENVTNCGRILSLYLGPADMLLTMDVTFAESLTRDDIDSTIDELERSIVHAFPQTTRIFIEPENRYDTVKAAKRRIKLIEKS